MFKDGRDDGKTPRERAGWRTQSIVMESGELVQFIPFRVESRADKFDDELVRASRRCMAWARQSHRREHHRHQRWYICIYIYIYWAATIKGVPEDKRWESEKVLAVIGMSCHPMPNVDAEDGARDPEAADAEVIPKDPEVPESVARRMYVRKADLMQCGETPGCVGCRNIFHGKPL